MLLHFAFAILVRRVKVVVAKYLSVPSWIQPLHKNQLGQTVSGGTFCCEHYGRFLGS